MIESQKMKKWKNFLIFIINKNQTIKLIYDNLKNKYV